MAQPSTVASLWQRRDLLRVLAGVQLKVSYETRWFGYVWWVLDPILMALVYAVLVGEILRRGDGHQPYVLFVMAGLLPWKCFSSSVTESIHVVARSDRLINAYNFPRAALPMGAVLSMHGYFLGGLATLIVAVAVYDVALADPHVQMGWSLLWIGPIAVAQLMISVGFALAFSCIGVFFKDLAHIIRYALLIAWFLSPGLYSLSDLIPGYTRLADVDTWTIRHCTLLNPVTHIIEAYRLAILHDRTPDLAALALVVVAGAVSIVAGLAIFRSGEAKFSKWV